MKRRQPRRMLAIVPVSEGAAISVLHMDGGSVVCERQTRAQFVDTLSPGEIGDILRKAGHTHRIGKPPAILCVPPAWCTSRLIALPATVQDHLEDFLRLQAETYLGPGGEALAIAHPPPVRLHGQDHVLLTACPAQRLQLWRERLSAAGMKLIAVCPACVPPQQADAESEAIVALTDASAQLQICVGGTAVSWESIAFTPAEQTPESLAATARRDVRISLAALPADVGQSVQTILLLADALPDALTDRLQRPPEDCTARVTWRCRVPRQPVISLLAAGAAGCLTASPKLQFHDQPVPGDRRIGRRRMAIGAAVLLAMLLLLELGFLLFQTQKLAHLRETHRKMTPDLAQATGLQDAVRALRPWYDRQPATLEILKDIATAFPKDGAVTLTHLTVSEGRAVTLNGHARSATAWLAMQEALQASVRISNLAVTQTRDASAGTGLVFSLQFEWAAGGTSS